MIVAFGTSTPTSMTEVETRICSFLFLKSSITASFSFGFIRPWRRPILRSGKIFSTKFLCSSVAALPEIFSDSSMSGKMKNACRPDSISARRNLYISCRLDGVMIFVMIFLRPLGISSRREISKFPKKASASVRGMGVAVIERR